jgi:hypothetical protein
MSLARAVLSLVAIVDAQVTPAEVVQIGKALYDALKDNQPMINVSTDWAGAVPKGISNWTSLENWQQPKTSQNFYVEFKNEIGMKLTKFEWVFAWKFGGSYQGTGKYVTQAGIQMASAYAKPTEHLDVAVTSLKPVNYGTTADPVAGLDIQVSVSSHGLFEKTTKTCTMTLLGDGTSVLGACANGTFYCATSPQTEADLFV